MKMKASEVVCKEPGLQPDKMRGKNVLNANRQLREALFIYFLF